MTMETHYSLPVPKTGPSNEEARSFGFTGLIVNLLLLWTQPYLRLVHPLNLSVTQAYEFLLQSELVSVACNVKSWLIHSVPLHGGAVAACSMWSTSSFTSAKDREPEGAHSFRQPTGLGQGQKWGEDLKSKGLNRSASKGRSNLAARTEPFKIGCPHPPL